MYADIALEAFHEVLSHVLRNEHDAFPMTPAPIPSALGS